MSFVLETDHKPLQALFNTTELSKTPPRIQRFRLRLMRFSVTVNHVKGKHHFTADALSRAPVGSSTEKDEHFVEEVESFTAQKEFQQLHSACYRYERPKSQMKNARKSGTTAAKDGQRICQTNPCYAPTGKTEPISALLMTCFSVTSA